jgi:hypothetical protein
VLFASVPVPIPYEPSINVTEPVAVVPAGGCTVAVSVTACPKVDGFVPDATLIEVAAGFTVCVRAVEVLLAK